MAAPRLTKEIELDVRAKLRTDIRSIAASGLVLAKPTYFTGKQDFVDELKKAGTQVVNGGDIEVRFCQMQWIGFEDVPDDCEDNPPVKILYKLHFFHEFISKRSDSSNSHDDFVAMILDLRNLFLANIVLPNNREREPLKQDGFMITGDENEFFKGAFGHYQNFIVKVEV